jgi:hypothetical protein
LVVVVAAAAAGDAVALVDFVVLNASPPFRFTTILRLALYHYDSQASNSIIFVPLSLARSLAGALHHTNDADCLHNFVQRSAKLDADFQN